MTSTSVTYEFCSDVRSDANTDFACAQCPSIASVIQIIIVLANSNKLPSTTCESWSTLPNHFEVKKSFTEVKCDGPAPAFLIASPSILKSQYGVVTFGFTDRNAASNARDWAR